MSTPKTYCLCDRPNPHYGYRPVTCLNCNLEYQILFTDESVIPFGKFKGTRLIDVPDSYLLWLYENDKMGRLRAYIEDNIQAIQNNSRQ